MLPDRSRQSGGRTYEQRYKGGGCDATSKRATMNRYEAARQGRARTDYLRVLENEAQLKDRVEDAAVLRRRLEAGPVVEDYVFREGPADLSVEDERLFRDIKLSDLFAPGKDELIVYHFMYAPNDELPCPMCTMWCDGFDAIEPHVRDRTNFALVARAGLGKFRAWGRLRGWRNIGLLSSENSSFNRDLGAEDETGSQIPGVSVFTRDALGRVRHFFTKHAELDEDNNRGIDLLSPVWNLFDLLPAGRGEWYPSRSYPREPET